MDRKKTAQPSNTEAGGGALRLRKSVGAIHTSGTLTLVQRKLANVLLFNSYDNLLKRRTHTIPVPIMCAMLGWDGSNKIEHLKDALATLAQTSIQFNLKEDGKDVWRVMSMLSFAEIRDGLCTYRYDEYLAERLFDPAIYATINLQIQRRFDSGHALNLYENCLRFKDTESGSTGWWTLEFLRNTMGATSTHYDDFRRLNSKAIKPAVEQINRESDIVLTQELKKEGRTVVSVRFLVREKTTEEQQVQQTPLPGMSFKDSVDEYAELRSTEAFLALRRHSISERLAFAWIRDLGEQKVLELVAYTETKDKEHKIKSTTSAYMRSLVDAGAEVGKSDYAKEKETTSLVQTQTILAAQKTEADRDRHDRFMRFQTTVVMKALTHQERCAHAEIYRLERGEGALTTWNPDKAEFAKLTERAQFDIWLRTKLKPDFDEVAFNEWQSASSQPLARQAA
jgi:plasmid replication initiation protein